MNIKPISIIATILLLVFTMTMVSPSITNVKASNSSNSYITPLIAGQYMTIGYVETWHENISGALILHVKYVINDTAWYLTEVHLAVNTSLSGIPRTKTGNPIPGLFPYSATGLWTKEYEFTINLTDVFGLTCPASNQTTIYIAAHADVAKVDEYGYTVQTETAWGNGTRFTTRGNWGMYFTYNIICEQYVPEQVCYLSGNARTAWANGYEFPGKNWATYVVYNGGNQSTTLLRGQNEYVGDVYIWRDGDSLVVRIVMKPGYALTKLHIHVATNLSGIPQANGNPIPGNFEYKVDFTGITTFYDAYISLDSSEQAASQLYVAIHAEVDTYTCS
ncbi:MAG: hypothetical protein QXE10_04460 [Desulfurococcaceae archaeon]